MTKRPDPRELIEQAEPMRQWQAEHAALLAAERSAYDRARELEALYAEALAEHKRAASEARASLKAEPLGPEPSAESDQIRGFLHELQLRKREARDERLRIVGQLAPTIDAAWDKARPSLTGEFLDWLSKGEELTAEFVRWHKQLRECRTRRGKDTPGPGGSNMRPAPDLSTLVRVYGIDPTFDPCAPVTSNGHGPIITRMEPGDEEPARTEPIERPRSIVAGARQ